LFDKAGENGRGSTCTRYAPKKPAGGHFGTSYDNRELSIGGIEKALQTAYPDYDVRRAFTSQIIIDKLKERDNLTIDNVRDAMDRLVADGVKEVVIQPTHVMEGLSTATSSPKSPPTRTSLTVLKSARTC
jgi:sirohydrochlorin cobaltochelatase